MSSTPLDSLRWKALALLCGAQFIVILDTAIIGVALPAIQSDLGSGGISPWSCRHAIAGRGDRQLRG